MTGAQGGPPSDGSWATVARRGRRKASLVHDADAASLQRSVRAQGPPRALAAVTDALARTSWFASTERQLRAALRGRPVRSLVCLGLGAVGASGAARHQLAFAVLLARSFVVPEKTIADPAMDSADTTAARDAGFRVAQDEGDFAAPRRGALLLFMPHCHWDLYERVTALCRSRGILSRVVLLGNALRRDMGDARVSAWFRAFCASEGVRQELCADAGSATLYCAFNDLAVVQFTEEHGRE